MYKSILKFIIPIFIASAFIVGCSNSGEKVKDAKEGVTEANKALEEANAAYLKDMEVFRISTSEQIAINDKMIAEMKIQSSKQKAEAKAEYKKNMEELEERNEALKKRMNEYNDKDKDHWEKFKAEFSHDMDELGKAFKGLGQNNVK